ncbi:hypothetical protein [Streptomyces sp. NRRL WC-3742]|uniref:hypothetical protein n=1 Tax=Streptomyces sp. NRRL WC-3742 TaxID=1463934 RepID=UPI000691B2C4|nr:hypothetical protein [Streptomyces sp. NRRL WC-3742]
MAISNPLLRRVVAYAESMRNLVGCGCGVVGVGLHAVGLGGSWWPGVVVGLYGAGALLTPGPKERPGPGPGPQPGPQPGPAKAATPAKAPAKAAAQPRRPAADPELDALAAHLAGVPLPDSAGVPELLASLRAARPGPQVRRIVRHRLPVAVDGYLRARTWHPWAGPGAPDPAVELGRAVAELSAELR